MFEDQGLGVWCCIRLLQLLDGIPTLAMVELHPIVLAILYFSSILQRLGEQIPKIVIIWCVLESEISDIAQILVELLGEPITEVLDRGRLFFLSPIFSYFCLFVAALSPCQGSLPLRKYMKICPSASRSSRLDCSRPRCVFILIYLAVPESDFRSRYGICCFVLGSRYCLPMPKSTTWMTLATLDPGRPRRKLSGLMSR
jgi:hypothetical protein